MIKWIKQKWVAFGDWVQSWFPGFKTKAIAIAGALGSALALLQEYWTQLPIKDFVSERQVLYVTLVLFTLTFWFQRLKDRNS